LRNPLLLIAAILIADQVLKVYIKTTMMLGQSFSMAGDWFYISFVENNGMAFGFEFAGIYGKYFLSIFRIIAVCFLMYYLVKLVKKGNVHKGVIYSLALIFAGALGNIIDSVFYGVLFNDSFGQVATLFPANGGYAPLLQGRVVDMFYFPIIESTFPSWFPFWGGEEFTFFSPVFNIADAAISVGIGILLIYQKHFFKEISEKA
jgi:signal peptidase II